MVGIGNVWKVPIYKVHQFEIDIFGRGQACECFHNASATWKYTYWQELCQWKLCDHKKQDSHFRSLAHRAHCVRRYSSTSWHRESCGLFCRLRVIVLPLIPSSFLCAGSGTRELMWVSNHRFCWLTVRLVCLTERLKKDLHHINQDSFIETGVKSQVECKPDFLLTWRNWKAWKKC